MELLRLTRVRWPNYSSAANNPVPELFGTPSTPSPFLPPPPSVSTKAPKLYIQILHFIYVTAWSRRGLRRMTEPFFSSCFHSFTFVLLVSGKNGFLMHIRHWVEIEFMQYSGWLTWLFICIETAVYIKQSRRKTFYDEYLSSRKI